MKASVAYVPDCTPGFVAEQGWYGFTSFTSYLVLFMLYTSCLSLCNKRALITIAVYSFKFTYVYSVLLITGYLL